MKNHSRFIVWVAVALVSLVGTAVFAQNGIVSIGSVSNLLGGDTVQAGQNLRFVIRFQNNTGFKADVSNAFRFSSFDGATWDSTTIDSIGPINDGGTPGDPSDDFCTFFMPRFNVAAAFQEISCDGIGSDTAGFIGAGTPSIASRQLPTTWNDSVYAITLWVSNSTAHNKHICIDTSFFPPGGTWVWVVSTSPGVLENRYPVFNGLGGQAYNQANGGYCFLIWDPAQGVDDGSGPNLPKEFSLQQNYPNPFNPTTKINFDLPVRANVNLSIYNVLGQKVKTLLSNESLPADRHSRTWDGTTDHGTTAASGIYFYKIEAGSFVQTKKMVLMK